MNPNPAPSENPGPPSSTRGRTAARIALVLAVASLPLFCLGGAPGLGTAVLAWILAYTVLIRSAPEAAEVRHSARMALILAIVGTLVNGVLLILAITGRAAG